MSQLRLYQSLKFWFLPKAKSQKLVRIGQQAHIANIALRAQLLYANPPMPLITRSTL